MQKMVVGDVPEEVGRQDHVLLEVVEVMEVPEVLLNYHISTLLISTMLFLDFNLLILLYFSELSLVILEMEPMF